jgi:hypothetical protein
MASISMSGKANAREVADYIQNEIVASAMSCELVDSILREFQGVTIQLLVFEKYYMRNSSRASLTVSVIGQGDMVVVDAVGSGGGQGALFNFSWGAEEDFVAVVEDILRRIGFE